LFSDKGKIKRSNKKVFGNIFGMIGKKSNILNPGNLGLQI